MKTSRGRGRRGRRFLGRFSIRSKLGALAATFVLVISALFGVAYGAMDTLATVRAYVGGEGLYSKAQKDATYHLTKYALSHQPEEYRQYVKFLAVPTGDRDARVELEKSDADLAIADEALIRGRNHKDDVRGMGHLFRRFRRVSYLDKAIRIWSEGDGLVSELSAIGEELHERISTGKISPGETSDFIARIDAVEAKLTPLEDEFSFTLGEAARWLKGVLVSVMALITVTFLGFGLTVAYVVSRHIIKDIDHIREGTERVARGDMAQRIVIDSDDELAALAGAFNRMTESLVESRTSVVTHAAKRENAEDKLESSVALFEATLETTADGILVTDGAKVVHVNEHFLDLWRIPAEVRGLDEQQLLDLLVDQVKHPAQFLARVRELDADARAESEELIECKDGRVFQRYSRPQRVAGTRAGRVWSFRDVTQQRQMQVRLVAADRMASMGALAAGVAHEINNPLSYVIANLAFLDEQLPQLVASPGEAGAHEILEVLHEAREGADRVRRIVRDLKVFSRSDDAETGAVDLKPLLEFSMNMAFNEIRHRARLVKDYGVGVPLVEGNEGRLGQVFLNLIVNAAQAIREGNVEQNEIRVVTRAEPSGAARVEVHDTGAGIAPEALQQIFLPFFTTKAIGVGTGLGLSICHEIVTALGGTISVDSVPGKGTVVRVVLPAARLTAPAKASPMSLQPRARSSAQVLIVDDDAAVGAALRRVLGNEHEVTVFTRGRAALDHLASGAEVDVILCDLMMPEMTGMDVHAELLRTSPKTAEKMIFVTGGAFTKHSRDFLDEVPNERVEKPFDAAALRALVRRVLRATNRESLPS